MGHGQRSCGTRSNKGSKQAKAHGLPPTSSCIFVYVLQTTTAQAPVTSGTSQVAQPSHLPSQQQLQHGATIGHMPSQQQPSLQQQQQQQQFQQIGWPQSQAMMQLLSGTDYVQGKNIYSNAVATT